MEAIGKRKLAYGPVPLADTGSVADCVIGFLVALQDGFRQLCGSKELAKALTTIAMLRPP